MITLDPEMVGNLAPPSKLTTGTTSEGKSVPEIPYARLPRMERLKISGKADTTEDNSGDEREVDGKKESREEREKRRMRGKGKSLSRYLRKQRKNVIDPTAVRLIYVLVCHVLTTLFLIGGHSSQVGEAKGGETAGIGCCCCWRDWGGEKAVCSGSFQEGKVIYIVCHVYGHTSDKNYLPSLMVFTSKSSKKRPAPAQGGPKPKKHHAESGSLKADVKKRSRPITQPLDARDSESEEDDIDGEEDNLDDHEEPEGDESAMQVDSRTDEHIPKDPSSNPKKKVPSFLIEFHNTYKKLLQNQRRAADPPPLLAEAKKVWSLVIQKSNSTTERKKHVKDLMSVIRGNVKDIVFKYNSRLIVQTIVRHGGQKERDEIAAELKGRYKQLAQNKLSKVWVLSCLFFSSLDLHKIVVTFCSSSLLPS